MERKKVLYALIALLLVSAVGFAAFISEDSAAQDAEAENNPNESNNVQSSPASNESVAGTVIVLWLGSSVMTVNGQEQAIDDNGTVPVAQNNRTLIPVRAVVEAMGGTVEWDNESQTTALSRGGDVIRLTIGSTTAYLNDVAATLDVAPALIDSRTMLPIRFIVESFGFAVAWDEPNAMITITESNPSGTVTATGNGNTGAAPVVYMTNDISPQGLMAVYQALGREANGNNVAVKISTGEPGGNHFLSPDLIKDLVQSVDGTIVECNTAYGGRRAGTAMHYQVAKDHGFTDIATVVIMDEESEMSLPVANGTHLQEDIVGARFADFDFHVVLSHFKGHAMGGFGGAIKNLSIGYASSAGKNLIHTAGASRTSFRGGDQDAFLESMAEAAKAVVDSAGDNILYINVMNHLSVDCDCSSNPAAPTMADIAILASLDPVALDKACVDLVYVAPDGQDLIERIESRNGAHTLDHAAEIGLGSLEYQLVSIDG